MSKWIRLKKVSFFALNFGRFGSVNGTKIKFSRFYSILAKIQLFPSTKQQKSLIKAKNSIFEKFSKLRFLVEQHMLWIPVKGLTEKHGKTYFLTIYTYLALKWARMMISSEKRGKKFLTVSFVNSLTGELILKMPILAINFDMHFYFARSTPF